MDEFRNRVEDISSVRGAFWYDLHDPSASFSSSFSFTTRVSTPFSVYWTHRDPVISLLLLHASPSVSLSRPGRVVVGPSFRNQFLGLLERANTSFGIHSLSVSFLLDKLENLRSTLRIERGEEKVPIPR